MKKVTAIVAAFLITATLGLGTFVVGANALTNKNSIPVSNSPTTSASTQSNQAQAQQIQQLQNLVNQYQQRDQQYQSEVSQAAQQIQSDSQQIQQYQTLITILQQQGVISISQDGRVFINSGGGFRNGDN